MDNFLMIIGLVLFLAFAAVSLVIRFRLTKYQEGKKDDNEDTSSVMAKIVCKAFMTK